MTDLSSIYSNERKRMRWPTGLKYTLETYFEEGMRMQDAFFQIRKFFSSDGVLSYVKVR